MRLTRKKAIDLSIDLWEWLAETGGEKVNWPGWKRNGGQHPNCDSDCFLCEYSSRVGESRTCDECPYRVRWGFCEDWEEVTDKPYTKWRVAPSVASRKRYAQDFLGQLKELKEGDMIPIGQVYEATSYQWGDYLPLIKSINPGIDWLVIVEQNAYQGDSLLLGKARDTGKFYFLTYGWGSCPGCDALQGCENLDDLASLREDLARGMKEFASASEVMAWWRAKDWRAEFISADLAEEFIEAAEKVLEAE